jgi:proteasome lid subunit RPN8/RPN11
MDIKENIINLLIELSKDFYPKQHICKLLKTGNVIQEISVFTNLKKNRPEHYPPLWTVVSAFSYGPFLEQFATSPDIIFEQDFIGFAISHVDNSILPTEEDKKLFAYRGDVHIILAHPYDNRSWAAYDNRGNKIDLELKDDEEL